MSVLPLEGVVVLEFTHVVMGPSGGLVLADLGADVIRVEPAPDGDPTRAMRGAANGQFYYFNRNKRCISLNLKSPEGLAIAHDLVKRADILMENFGPGTMDRLGLGWDAMHALNPRLIYLALKGFLPGPYEHRLALDEIAQFMSGLAYMTGPPGRPLRAGSSVVDIMGGVMGVVGVLAALHQRERDGIGRKITSALFESSAFMVGQHMANEVANGQPATPMPARRGGWGIYQTFPTRDGSQVFIGITSDKQWQSFCVEFNRPHLAADERFRTNEVRVANRDALRPEVAAVAMEHDMAALCVKLEAARLPFSPVQTPSDLFEDPQLNADDRMLRIRMGDGTIAKLPSLPICIDDEAPGLRLQPPEVGEHTGEILTSLGYTAEQVAALRTRGAVK